MSSTKVLDIPPEIWIKIAGYFGSDPMYYIGGCCGGSIRPSPGAGTVGPLPSSAPSKDLISLSCVCRMLRSTLEHDIKAHLSLCMQRKDGRLVHQYVPDFPSRDDKNKDVAAEIHELKALPLGSHILHLRLTLRESGNYFFDALKTLSQEYCDDAAPILLEIPRLQSLQLSARFSNSGNDYNLSPAFCRALSSLRDLRILQLRGLTIPADCPTLDNIEHIQTDAIISSFKSLPRLKDLRQQPDMFAPGYDIPIDVLARLEVLHHCSPDDMYDRALLPNACRSMKDTPTDRQCALRELVLNGYPTKGELLDILHGLGSPHLRTFVCFGLERGNESDHDMVVQALRKACPNLTTLDFPKPGHGH